MIEAVDHVRGLVDLTSKVQRDRVAFFVDRPKRWGDLARILNGHETWHFDRRYWIDCYGSTASEVLDKLKELGAPLTATILFEGGWYGSETPTLALHECIGRFFGSDDGVVISCIPGRLVYFEGHEHDQSGILKR